MGWSGLGTRSRQSDKGPLAQHPQAQCARKFKNLPWHLLFEVLFVALHIVNFKLRCTSHPSKPRMIKAKTCRFETLMRLLEVRI